MHYLVFLGIAVCECLSLCLVAADTDRQEKTELAHQAALRACPSDGGIFDAGKLRIKHIQRYKSSYVPS